MRQTNTDFYEDSRMLRAS